MAGTARELPPYLRLVNPSALPVLTVGSCHLPREYTAAAVHHYAGHRCSLCGCVVECEVRSSEYTAQERRWRHVQHLLGGCACHQYTTAVDCYVQRAPAPTDLRANLLAAVPASRAVVVHDAIACASTGCPESVRAGYMPLFLDFVLFFGIDNSSTAASLASRHLRCVLGCYACSRDGGSVAARGPAAAEQL